MRNAPILQFPSDQARADAQRDPAPSDHSWFHRHRWGISMLAVTTLGSLWWRRRARQRRIKLEPMSEGWLREREYESGQQGENAWER